MVLRLPTIERSPLTEQILGSFQQPSFQPIGAPPTVPLPSPTQGQSLSTEQKLGLLGGFASGLGSLASGAATLGKVLGIGSKGAAGTTGAAAGAAAAPAASAEATAGGGGGGLLSSIGTPAVAAPLAIAGILTAGLFSAFGGRGPQTNVEIKRLERLKKLGILPQDLELPDDIELSRKKQFNDFLAEGISEDFIGKLPDGRFVNMPFLKTGDPKFLTPDELAGELNSSEQAKFGSAAFAELFGDEFVNAPFEKRRAIAELALKNGLVKEAKGSIFISPEARKGFLKPDDREKLAKFIAEGSRILNLDPKTVINKHLEIAPFNSPFKDLLLQSEGIKRIIAQELNIGVNKVRNLGLPVIVNTLRRRGIDPASVITAGLNLSSDELPGSDIIVARVE